MKNRQHCFGFRDVVSDYIRTGLQAGFKATAGIFKFLFFVYCVAKTGSAGYGFDHSLCHRQVRNRLSVLYNEVRVTTGLTIYRLLGAVEKNLFFFLPTKPARNPRKKRSDHSFYHRQTRNMRKQWTKNAPRASALERKRYESTQSAREDEPTSVGVVEAASSSLVTQTKKARIVSD